MLSADNIVMRKTRGKKIHSFSAVFPRFCAFRAIPRNAEHRINHLQRKNHILCTFVHTYPILEFHKCGIADNI
jgi:hypothetical protein